MGPQKALAHPANWPRSKQAQTRLYELLHHCRQQGLEGSAEGQPRSTPGSGLPTLEEVWRWLGGPYVAGFFLFKGHPLGSALRPEDRRILKQGQEV